MANTSIPSAVNNDQVFLTIVIERLDQLNQTLTTIDSKLEALETKQATPVVNVNFDIKQLAQELNAIQAQRDDVVAAIETKTQTKSKK